MKLFSIIIPCHNSVKDLVNCYESLIKQTIGMDKLEVIFVDDASEDDTFSLLCEMEKMYPEDIMVIRLEKNMRQGGARNIGMEYATGEYISFVDSDDTVSPVMYERLAEVIKSYSPDIIKFSHDIVTEDSKVIKEVRQCATGMCQVDSIDKRKEMLIMEILDYGCWNKVYRKEMVDRSGACFAEHMIYEEPKFTYPLHFYVDSFYLIDEVFYHYEFNLKGTMQEEMRNKGKLYDHISVQIETYEFIAGSLTRNTLSSYEKEIEAYFIKTCLCETILFAGWGNLMLEKQAVKYVREWILKEFPRYEENIYLKCLFSEQHKFALQIMDREMSQQELDNFCKEAAQV